MYRSKLSCMMSHTTCFKVKTSFSAVHISNARGKTHVLFKDRQKPYQHKTNNLKKHLKLFYTTVGLHIHMHTYKQYSSALPAYNLVPDGRNIANLKSSALSQLQPAYKCATTVV